MFINKLLYDEKKFIQHFSEKFSVDACWLISVLQKKHRQNRWLAPILVGHSAKQLWQTKRKHNKFASLVRDKLDQISHEIFIVALRK